MRSVWQQSLVVALVLVSASWNESYGQSSRWQLVGLKNAEGSSLWLDTQSLQEIDRTAREGWFEFRYGQAQRDSSMFERNGRYRGEDSPGYRYFSVERRLYLMRADCARRRIMTMDWMKYGPDGSVVSQQQPEIKIRERTVSPENTDEVMFNALCRRQPWER